MNNVNWWTMKIGDCTSYSNSDFIRRVPGGWTYGDLQGVVFIPYCKESTDKDLSNENKSEVKND